MLGESKNQLSPTHTALSTWLVGLVMLVCVSADAQSQKLGDVNHDGALTVCDVALILNHIDGRELLTTNQLELPLADTDTNGVINFADAQRVIDMIVGRVPLQDFDTTLLASDDGDGFSYLEDWHHGTNPFLRDTDGNGIEDEIQARMKGAVYLARPPVEAYRDKVEGGIVLAQPPVEVLRQSSEGGASIVLGQPPVEVVRPSADGGAGIVLAQPPVEVLRASSEGGASLVVGQPPLEVFRTNADGSARMLVRQPAVKVLRQ